MDYKHSFINQTAYFPIVNTNFNLDYRENTLQISACANITEDVNNDLTKTTFRQGLITKLGKCSLDIIPYLSSSI